MKSLFINGREYRVQHCDSRNKTARAFVRDGTITITLPVRWPDRDRQEAIEKLEQSIHRMLLRSYGNPLPALSPHEKIGLIRTQLPPVARRIHEWNDRHFRASLGRIRLRANLSTWGSCSPKNNITLNLALLFMPVELLDYVIVHELAHTIVRNHSLRFWACVRQALPDYHQRKKELRRYLLTT